MSEFDPSSSSEQVFGGEFVWQPTPDYIQGSHIQRFMQAHHFDDWDTLHQAAIDDVGWFWDAMLRYLDIQFYKPYTQIVDLSRGKPWARWAIGGQMNIVHNALDKWMGTESEHKIALRWEGEEGVVQTYTYRQLYQAVNRTANALRSLGLGKGDAIGLYMPMSPEIAIALLAIAKIGGIILPLFSGYGAGAVATRLADAEAKALFVADGSYRRGRVVNMKAVADEALKQVPSLKHVIVHQRVGTEITWHPQRDHWWHELIPAQADTAATEITEAEDLIMIIYTSGTTGRPKGAVHTHIGFPIKAATDMAMGLDLRQEDTLYWMTDMGWMMGPWEVFGTLILGATMLFFDGAPDYPNEERLWKLVSEHGVTHFGVSPTLIRALMAHGEGPVKKYNLSALRAFGSTGEPWNPDPWMWLFQVVGEGKRPIINYSGGTEISGGIVMGNVVKPLKPAAFSGPNVDMAADVVNDAGESIRGQVGELVIRQPWIGMTRGFWKDPDRYLETYWNRWPDTWVHGDFAAIDADGQWYILGRSDDTIKVAGKRLGPAEAESILVKHPAVLEAGAVGVPHKLKGSALVLAVVLAADYEASDKLAAALKDLVVAGLGKALKPQDIIFVPDLPKTRNAKVMRRVLRAAYLDLPAGDLSALVNPDVVEAIRRIGRSRR